MHKVFVAKNDNAVFQTIQDAIDSIRVFPLEDVTIHIADGIYYEKIIVPENKPNVHLIGESPENTILTFDDYAEKTDYFGNKLGTFRTATATIHADNFTLENITIENSAGFGKDIGQAVALYLSGDRCTINNTRLLGNQDTLYTSKGRQFFKDCYIEGHVDFIFGAATAVFEECEIHSLREGYVTAASTPKTQPYGFVFFNCKLTGEATADSVFLGRPWRPYAHTLFINCMLGKHIKLVGWDNWRNPNNEKTARYGEYNSLGPGSNQTHRIHWANQYHQKDTDLLTLKQIFTCSSQWLPNL
ncbi:pectinesterase family protein [Aquibacillus rhizosphaerae]|uniref:Pectinesterase family protein n=1 Tax=Aquibacillus rhizosphaerae TaxID=3051431 RepID=A0ABT7L343_9BACI|nr:pectinesterase family protein [Aquibacillus sp. LR5S19]MDL4840272.1 pectinesterase family protein [Aquibacillus sp. LR5S19]